MKRQTSGQGFSLVEVLFALFLIVLVIGIASQVAGNTVRNATAMKEATFARWVGLNQLDLYQMEVSNGQVTSGSEGEENMGNMDWRWVREVKSSSSDILNEVRVSVYRAGDSSDGEPVMVVKGYVPVQ